MRNPAIYEKRIVAFLDILGFSTMVQDSKVDTEMRRKIMKAMKIIRKSGESEESEYKKVSTFSDSAVISYPLHSNSSLFYLLIDVIHLQLMLGTIGVMIRGGIAIGDCYHDEKIVFGPAMNEAYRLEKKVALWPRVVIMEKTIEYGITESSDTDYYSLMYDTEDIMSCLKKDDYDKNNIDHNIYFVDFLRQPQELTEFGDEYFDWLRRFRVAIVEGLMRYCKNNNKSSKNKTDIDRVFKKYRWLLNYWNNVVCDEKAFFPVPNIDLDSKKEFRKKYKDLRIREKYPYY